MYQVYFEVPFILVHREKWTSAEYVEQPKQRALVDVPSIFG